MSRKKTDRTCWTPAEDTLLCELVDAGVTLTEISEQIRRSKGSVEVRMSRLGLRQIDRGVVKLDPFVREAILRRRSQGWRPSRIAIQVGERVSVVETVIAQQAAREAERSVRTAA